MRRMDGFGRHGTAWRAAMAGARLLAVFALLLSAMTVGLRTGHAQGDDDTFDYDEDGVVWSVTWDPDVWSEGDGSGASVALGLESDQSNAQFAVITGVDENPEECLAAVVPDFENGAEMPDAVDLEGADGDPLVDADDDVAYQVRTGEVGSGSDRFDATVVHACYQLTPDALLWVVALTPDDADELGDVYALYDGISVDGDDVPLDLAALAGTDGDAAPSDDEEASDDEASPSEDEDASPSDDEPSDDEDATPSDDDASPSDDDGGQGAADEDAGTYLSPTYGYTIEWDPDRYTVDAEFAADSGSSRDRLDLLAGDTSITYIEGTDEDWSDPADCVETLTGEVRGFDIDDAEPVEDADGDPFTVSEDEREVAVYSVDVSGGSLVYIFECRADPDSDLIVGFTTQTNQVDDVVDDVYPQFEGLADSLEFDGGGDEDASPSDDEDASPSDDEDASPSDDEDASPSDDEDASPSDDEDASPSDDEDAAPSDDEDAPSDDADPSDAPAGGVDGNTYISPTYFYLLTWDEDVWTVEDEDSDDDIDTLSLSSDLLTLNVTGDPTNGDDIDDCVDSYVELLSDRGDGDAAILETEDGPALFPADDGSYTEAIVVHSDGGTQFATDLYCIQLSSDAVVILEFTGVPDDFTTDEASEQINDILGSLVVI